MFYLVLQVCIAGLCMSSYDYLGAQLTYDLLEVGKSSYWLLQVELLDVIGGLNFRYAQSDISVPSPSVIQFAFL